MRRKISQREAHRLANWVEQLERRNAENNRSWSSEYHGGVLLGTLTRDADWLNGQIHAARKLGHAVIVTTDTAQKDIKFWAVKK